MTDKNGIEIKTGDIVEITGAYFKNDNGLYFVENSPGDPSWCGKDYCLKKISKKGKISIAKHNICFWPIAIFVSDRSKAAEGHKWNDENAQIEVKIIENMSEVSAYFQEEAEKIKKVLVREIWDFGEDSEHVKQHKTLQSHYEAIAQKVKG